MARKYHTLEEINGIIYETDSIEETIDKLNFILETESTNYFVISKLGNLYYAIDNLDESRKCFTLLTKIESSAFNSDGYLGLAKIYKRNNNFKKALEYLDKVQTCNDAIVKSYHEKGRIYFSCDNSNKALKWYFKALESIDVSYYRNKEYLKKIKAGILTSISYVYIRNKKYDKALEYIRKAKKNIKGLNTRFSGKTLDINQIEFHVSYKLDIIGNEELLHEQNKHYYTRVISNPNLEEIKEHVLRHFYEYDDIKGIDDDRLFSYIRRSPKNSSNLISQEFVRKYVIPIPDYIESATYNYIEVVMQLDDDNIVTAYPTKVYINRQNNNDKKNTTYKKVRKPKSQIDKFKEKYNI